MTFCGHCGLQLPPGSTTCPRCGSATEPDVVVEDLHTEDPTIAAMPHAAPSTPQPGPMGSPTPPHQQKLVLRPGDGGPGFGPPAPNEPTSMMSAQPPISPSDPHSRLPHPGYPPQSGSTHASQRAPYPGYSPQSDMGYSHTPGQFGGIEPLPARRPTRRGSARRAGLLIVLFLLLVALATVVVFAARPGLLKGPLGNNATPTVATTPTDQARSVIQQYYNDINNRDYQAAYNLWGSDYQRTNSFSDFSAGYAHTRHDDVTINSLTALSDGTVRADITIVATEETASGTVTSTYQGTYIIGQENGTWKFLSGTFQKIG